MNRCEFLNVIVVVVADVVVVVVVFVVVAAIDITNCRICCCWSCLFTNKRVGIAVDISDVGVAVVDAVLKLLLLLREFPFVIIFTKKNFQNVFFIFIYN